VTTTGVVSNSANAPTNPVTSTLVDTRSVSDSARLYLGSLEISSGGHEVKSVRCRRAGVAVYAALYASPPYALSVPALPVPRLAVNLTAARVSGGLEGDRPHQFYARRHSLFLTPAGAAVTWSKDSPSRHLGIYFDPEVFAGSDDAGQPSHLWPTLLNASLAGVGQLADHLVSELQSTANMRAEAADSLSRLILIGLTRRLGRAPSDASALTSKALARLEDYVVAHLGDRILVADLARQTGLSPNHFAASFTRQTGRSPHRFVLAIRIERARAMLAGSTASLAQVAQDCGFASQQHLTNVFRRHLCTTPGRYRTRAPASPT
jgi:AraC family transcriptional regulator